MLRYVPNITVASQKISLKVLDVDGNEVEFSFSGNVDERPLRGSGDPQMGFHIELSKPLTEPGVYVISGFYKGVAFKTYEWVV